MADISTKRKDNTYLQNIVDDLHSQNSTLNIDNFFTLPILEKKIECSGNSRWWHQGDIAKTIRKVKAVSSWIPQIGIRYNLLCHTLYLTILQFPDLFREKLYQARPKITHV